MTDSAVKSPAAPRPAIRKKIEELSHQNIALCYQCQKCSNGCPVAFAMDIPPHRLMHLLQLGLVDEVLRSDTIWLCAGCQTCTTRCPNNIDIAHVLDTLRKVSDEEGKALRKNVPLFHRQFLATVKQYGRVHELQTMTLYTLKTQGIKGLLKQANLGLTMLKKGKLKLLPASLLPKSEVKAMFKTKKKEAGK